MLVPYLSLAVSVHALSASSVYVTGIDSVGETLTGHYTYSGSDPESGTTYRWLRADNALGPYDEIPGATNIQYTLVPGDDNMWYAFEVTVRDTADNEGDPVTAVLEFASGAGTAGDPWQIGNAMQLSRVAQYTGLAHTGKHFLVIQDIDLGDPHWSEGDGWQSIGTNSQPFRGVFDGGGHTISNLTLSQSDPVPQGLFSHISGAEIRHLRLEAIDLACSADCGGLVGKAEESRIDDIRVSGAITSDGINVGGVVGSLENSTMLRVHMNGTVQAQGVVGGVVGSSENGVIALSASRGAVEGDHTVGGFLGSTTGMPLIHNSYSHASVHANGGGVGGFAGSAGAGGAAVIYRCFSSGAVTFGEDQGVGGFQGDGELTASRDCYWDLDTSGRAVSAGGTGKTTEEMKQQATYKHYNFVSLWMIDEDNDYPEFQDFSGHSHPKEVGFHELDGSGDPQDPYIITTADELNAMRQNVAAHYRLGNDIDLSATVIWNAGLGWEPVGGPGPSFTGSLNGNGHTLSNLTIFGTGYGLFGWVDGALIRNLKLDSVHISGGSQCGALAGYLSSSSRVDNVQVTGEIVSRSGPTGGVIGYLNDSILLRVHMLGEVTGEDVVEVGGVAGRSNLGRIFYSSSRGAVEGLNTVGGLIGAAEGGVISDCYSHASVHANGGAVGGFAGSAGASGAVVIYRCFSSGAVTFGEDQGVGGFQGDGELTASRDCYWDLDTSGRAVSAGGTGKTTGEMKQRATYKHYNFVSLWMIDEDNDYPVFRDMSGYATHPQVVLPAGSGDEWDPYIITNAHELNAVRNNLSAHYRLDNDIDMSSTLLWNDGRGWEPVGVPLGTFGGVFDGAGYTISNLHVNGQIVWSSHTAMFRYAHGAAIRNVALDNVHVYGGENSGGLVGYAQDSQVDEVRVSGVVHATGMQVGGVIGHLHNSALARAHMNGVVSGMNRVGGVVGLCENSAIRLSSSAGAVEAEFGAGGFAAEVVTSTISNCFSLASVHSWQGPYVGGFAGSLSGLGQIINSYSAGIVTHDGGGGGGFLQSGSTEDDVLNCYWDMEASDQDASAGGLGRSTAEMTWPRDTNTTYIGWDFLHVWTDDATMENNGYPRLLNPGEYNLIYHAGAGGVITGLTPQVVAQGGDGAPVGAVADAGASFHQWSDGVTNNARTDVGISTSMLVTALFVSQGGVPVDWYARHGLSPGEGEDWSDLDARDEMGKGMTLRDEYIADTDPTDANDIFRCVGITGSEGIVIHFNSSTSRVYSLHALLDLLDGDWSDVPETGPRYGVGGADSMADTNEPPVGVYYRMGVNVP